jgi:hypothetical protein
MQAFQNAIRDDWAKLNGKSNVIHIADRSAWICEVCGKPASRKQGQGYYCQDHDHTSGVLSILEEA